MIRTLLVHALCVVALCAQGTAPDAPRPPQDEAALELLDRADALIYTPKLAGLKKVSYVHAFGSHPGIRANVTWTAPNSKKVEIVVSPDAAPAIRERVKSDEETFKRVADRHADILVGKESRASYASDEIRLEGDREVRVIARSPHTKDLFDEYRLSFDAAGLPVSMTTLTKGGRIEMKVKYRKIGERTVVDRAEFQADAGQGTISFSYQELGGFLFPVSIVTKRSGAPSLIHEFKEIRVEESASSEGRKED